jgi:hypothetical protein
MVLASDSPLPTPVPCIQLNRKLSFGSAGAKMAPSSKTRRKTGSSAADPLEKLRAKLVSGGAKALKRKRDELEQMTKDRLVADAAKVGITMTHSKDAGRARAELFHEYGLGFPMQSGWTKSGIKYMLSDVLGQTLAPSATRDKQTATDTLVQALLTLATVPLPDGGSTTPVPSAAPGPGTASVPLVIDAGGTILPTTPGEMSLQRTWRAAMTPPQLLSSAAAFQITRVGASLPMTEDGWEQVVNFECCPEFLPVSYPRSDMRGVHFITATVRWMRENPEIMACDDTGFGAAPAAVNCHDIALEWMGLIYLNGVRRMGGGATFQQIRFFELPKLI